MEAHVGSKYIERETEEQVKNIYIPDGVLTRCATVGTN